MSYSDQKRYFEILSRYERKFDRAESDDYSMLKKRHKDDEDLDRLSMQRLEVLYQKYHVNRPKKNYDHLFKKTDDSETEN